MITLSVLKRKIPNTATGAKGNLRYWKDYYDTQDKMDNHLQKKREIDGDNVRTFVSNDWTFEYCLCKYGLAESVYESIKADTDSEFSSLPEDIEEKAIKIYSMIENKGSENRGNLQVSRYIKKRI